MSDPLKPTVALLSKLGSIVVHADELAHPVKGHVFDHFALKQLVEDPEVREWLKSMGPFVPVKRS